MKSRSARTLVGATVVALALAIAPPASATNIGTEGCTPGYWKNHTDNWEEYSPSDTLGSVFMLPASLQQYANVTLEQALSFRGGTGTDGAARILLRAATAAVLNAAHEGLGYPYRRGGTSGILARVNAALAGEDRQQMLNLAAMLDAANNLGCPLN